MGTIGAVSDLAKRKRVEWKSEAIRALWELEQQAWTLRTELERGDECPGGMVNEAKVLHSQVAVFVTLVDSDAAIMEVGLE
jgi:hypothetical protein